MNTARQYVEQMHCRTQHEMLKSFTCRILNNMTPIIIFLVEILKFLFVKYHEPILNEVAEYFEQNFDQPIGHKQHVFGQIQSTHDQHTITSHLIKFVSFY